MQSKVWIFDKRTAPILANGTPTWDRVAFWDKEASVRVVGCAAIDVPSCRRSQCSHQSLR